jgi:hypothetical protein
VGVCFPDRGYVCVIERQHRMCVLERQYACSKDVVYRKNEAIEEAC